MKDSNLQGLALQRFYDLRHEGDGMVSLRSIVPQDASKQEFVQFANVCDQLAQRELIK
jgi:hypothetical protein